MRGVHKTILATRQRLFLALLIRHCGTGLAVGASVGLALTCLDRLIGLPTDWWWLAAIPTLAGAAVGFTRALIGRPGNLIAAGTLDDNLALSDRLTTGLTLPAGQDAAFTTLALAQADAAAAQASPRRAVRIRLGNAWYAWPIIAGAAASVGIFAPRLDLLGREQLARRESVERSRQSDVADRIAEAVQAIAPAAPADSGPEARPEQLAELDRLREELESGTLSADEGTAKAVQELQEVAQTAQRSADDAAARQQALSQSLSRLGQARATRAAGTNAAPDTPGGEPPILGEQPGESASADAGADSGEESPLTRAVRAGDLGAAREAARELMHRPTMSADDRRTLAEDLQRLASDMDELERQEAERAAPEQQDSGKTDASASQPARATTPDNPSAPSSEPSSPVATDSNPPATRTNPGEPTPRLPDGTPPPGESREKNSSGGKPPGANPAGKPSQPTQPSSGDSPRQPQRPDSAPSADGKPQTPPQASEGEQQKPAESKNQSPASQSPSTTTPRDEQREGGGESAPNQPSGQEQDGKSLPQAANPKADDTHPRQERPQQGAGEQKDSTSPSPGERSPQSDQSGSQQQPQQQQATPGAQESRIDEKALREQLERSGMTPEEAQRTAEQMAAKAREQKAQQDATQKRRQLAQRLKETAESLEGEKSDQTTPPGRPESGPDAAAPEAQAPPPGEPSDAPSKPGGQPENSQSPESPSELPSPGEQSAPRENQQSPSPGEAPNGPDGPKLPGEIPAPSKEAIERLAQQLDRMTADNAHRKADKATAERAREQARQLAERLSPEQQERLRQWGEGLAKQRPGLARKLAGDDTGDPPFPPGAGDAGDPSDDAAPGAADPPPPLNDRADRGGTGANAGSARRNPSADESRSPFIPTRTELVDARDSGTASPRSSPSRDQVVAEWLAPPALGGSATPGAPSPAARMRQAARSAQKAVEERAIPARYDRLVQRYFRRLPDEVARRAQQNPSTPAAAPAQDAP